MAGTGYRIISMDIEQGLCHWSQWGYDNLYQQRIFYFKSQLKMVKSPEVLIPTLLILSCGSGQDTYAKLIYLI